MKSPSFSSARTIYLDSWDMEGGIFSLYQLFLIPWNVIESQD